MERLTKKELRALLECIKDCYPICDLETFGQRVISRLSKIVPKEIIPYNVVNPRRERNAYLPHFHDGYTPSKNKIFDQRLGKRVGVGEGEHLVVSAFEADRRDRVTREAAAAYRPGVVAWEHDHLIG